MLKSILTLAMLVNLNFSVPAQPVEPIEPSDPVAMITEECQKQNIEPTLAIAISRLETGRFTSSAFNNYNNFGGMSVNEVPIYYNTKNEGVRNFVENLKENYIQQGLNTPEEISKKYCPANARQWANVVNELMEEEND